MHCCGRAALCRDGRAVGTPGRPSVTVTLYELSPPTNVLILEKWVGDKPPTAEEFAKAATVIDVAADHTLLMSNHMPHAGGDMTGRRGHTIITRPDLMSRKLSEKKTFWLAPEQSRDA